MVKIKDDFFSRIARAYNANDQTTVHQMLISQIAWEILNHRDEVVDLLGICGITLAKNAHRNEIAGVIAKNLQGNQKLSDGLAFMIARDTGSIPQEKESSLVPVVGELVGSVSSLIGNVFANKAAQTNAQAQADANRDALVAEMLKQQGKESTNTMLFVFGGVALLAAVYFIVRKAN